jgi:hypothetical protein
MEHRTSSGWVRTLLQHAPPGAGAKRRQRDLEARQPGREARHHREQHECGKHEEDEGEEQSHGDPARVRFGTTTDRGAFFVGKAREHGTDGRAESIGREERLGERSEAR